MAVKYFNGIPVVALRGRVVFPDTTITFDAGRLISLAAVKNAAENNMQLLVCAQPDSEKDEITADDICKVGTVVKIKQITRLPSDSVRILCEGLCRVRVRSFSFEECFCAEADEIKVTHGDPVLEEAYFRTAKDIMRDISSSENRFTKDAIARLDRCGDPDEYINVAANSLPLRDEIKQQILECDNVTERLRMLESASTTSLK